MRIVGVTGGIGSGKSTVVRMFEKLNVPSYIADDRAKELMITNDDLITEISNLLGTDAYMTVDLKKQLNRDYIAQKVFSNDKLLSDLNQLVHPAVRLDFKKWLASQSSSYIIYEAAILHESGGDKLCDEIVVVAASWEERLSRVMKRDNTTAALVKSRADKQWSQIKKASNSNIIIHNENIAMTERYVSSIHSFLLKTE